MKLFRIKIIILLISILCIQQVVYAQRTFEGEKAFGTWVARIVNEPIINQNGDRINERYVSIATESRYPNGEIQFHIEIIIQNSSKYDLSLLTLNSSGQAYSNIGIIDAVLLVGNHTSRLTGEAIAGGPFIYYMMPDLPRDFFKWVKSAPALTLQFPLGRINIPTSGLTEAAKYAFKLRKSI